MDVGRGISPKREGFIGDKELRFLSVLTLGKIHSFESFLSFGIVCVYVLG